MSNTLITIAVVLAMALVGAAIGHLLSRRGHRPAALLFAVVGGGLVVLLIQSTGPGLQNLGRGVVAIFFLAPAAVGLVLGALLTRARQTT